MKDLIDTLRSERFKVTILDVGADNAEFVLAVAIQDPLDIWYLALAMRDQPTIPKISGGFLVFPELAIDAQTYEYICAESKP